MVICLCSRLVMMFHNSTSGLDTAVTLANSCLVGLPLFSLPGLLCILPTDWLVRGTRVVLVAIPARLGRVWFAAPDTNSCNLHVLWPLVCHRLASVELCEIVSHLCCSASELNCSSCEQIVQTNDQTKVGTFGNCLLGFRSCYATWTLISYVHSLVHNLG